MTIASVSILHPEAHILLMHDDGHLSIGRLSPGPGPHRLGPVSNHIFLKSSCTRRDCTTNEPIILTSSHRLNLQHYLWKDVFGYLIHPKIPLSSKNLRVADIGTGTGFDAPQPRPRKRSLRN